MVSSNRGAALVITMAVTFLLLGLIGSLLPFVVTEQQIVANHRRAIQRQYAAEAGLELVVQELAHLPTWPLPLADLLPSSLWSQVPRRVLEDGHIVDLAAMTDELRQGDIMKGLAHDWTLYGHTRLEDVAPSTGAIGSHVLAAWVAEIRRPGAGGDPHARLVIYAAALGPGHAHRAVVAVVRRRTAQWVEVSAWSVAR